MGFQKTNGFHSKSMMNFKSSQTIDDKFINIDDLQHKCCKDRIY